MRKKNTPTRTPPPDQSTVLPEVPTPKSVSKAKGWKLKLEQRKKNKLTIKPPSEQPTPPSEQPTPPSEQPTPPSV